MFEIKVEIKENFPNSQVFNFGYRGKLKTGKPQKFSLFLIKPYLKPFSFYFSLFFIDFLNLELQLIEIFKAKYGLASEFFENILGTNSNSHICAQNLIQNQY